MDLEQHLEWALSYALRAKKRGDPDGSLMAAIEDHLRSALDKVRAAESLEAMQQHVASRPPDEAKRGT